MTSHAAKSIQFTVPGSFQRCGDESFDSTCLGTQTEFCGHSDSFLCKADSFPMFLLDRDSFWLGFHVQKFLCFLTPTEKDNFYIYFYHASPWGNKQHLIPCFPGICPTYCGLHRLRFWHVTCSVQRANRNNLCISYFTAFRQTAGSCRVMIWCYQPFFRGYIVKICQNESK